MLNLKPSTRPSLQGTAHAEFMAINTLPPMDFSDCELYVTVEPCIMCGSALRQMRFKKVYFGCWNDKFGGCGGVVNIHEEWVSWLSVEGVSFYFGGRGLTRVLLVANRPSSEDPPLPVEGGHFKTEAVLLLRKFYLKENVNGN